MPVRQVFPEHGTRLESLDSGDESPVSPSEAREDAAELGPSWIPVPADWEVYQEECDMYSLSRRDQSEFWSRFMIWKWHGESLAILQWLVGTSGLCPFVPLRLR